jgi:hypothetical protein
VSEHRLSTLGEWLASREPQPPRALSGRLRELLADQLDAPAAEAHDRCLDAAERLLRTVVEREGATRDDAFDLLAADALVTYAFEAAAGDPVTIGVRADDAMRRLSSLGAHDERGRDPSSIQ